MDWKTTRIWIVAALLVALGGGVFALWHKRSKESDDGGAASATASLPHVAREQIDSIEITRPHEVPVRLAKVDGTWRVVAPVDAKADQNAVNAALDKISALESTGVAARHRENHARLEVDAAHGVRVTATHGSHPLIDFWLGVYRSGSTMVRLDGQDAVHMVDGSIRYVFAKETKDWRDRAIVDVPPESITALTVQGPNGTFHFTHAPTWAQAAGDPPIERFSPAKVGTLVASLARLRATDFAEPNAAPSLTGIGSADQTTLTAEVPASDAGPATHIVVHVGNTNGAATDRFVTRDGDTVVYVISGYVADRLRPHDTDVQDAPDAGAPAAPPPGPPEMPQLQMGGGGGGQQIPPELMRQIQQQLQQGHGGAQP